MSIDRSKIAKQNKAKGSRVERTYASIFREMREEFRFCKTSRFGSKLFDNAGIDLVFIPFNVQIKAGKQKGLQPVKELQYLETQMKEVFPENAPEHEYPKILVHHKDAAGKKRTQYDSIVYMTFEDFTKLVMKVEEWKF